MTSTQTSSHSPRWPLIVLAIVGLIIAAPFLLALLGLGIALTVGLAALAVKVGVIALAVWAVVMVFKAIFGSSHAKPLPPSQETLTTTRYDPEAESEREKREHLAKLDKELELAIARKNAGQES